MAKIYGGINDLINLVNPENCTQIKLSSLSRELKKTNKQLEHYADSDLEFELKDILHLQSHVVIYQHNISQQECPLQDFHTFFEAALKKEHNSKTECRGSKASSIVMDEEELEKSDIGTYVNV